MSNDILLETREGPVGLFCSTPMAAISRNVGRKAAMRLLPTGKEAFYAQIEMALPQAYDFAADVMVANMMEADAEEGIGAFIEERHPNWQPL